ncbi:MAG: hypothetical protein GX574_07400 [Lentisphaerae bacterium]|nr:hypothetical protein [Lentisphaerota bacterium]OQC11653.1 MAG: hypothetical protein BWX73_03424 [Lentisphaerae bacterium ADurb.Bin082]HQL87501.1 hypothetical protein [Lentisphaeria bacterium]
MLNLSKIKKAAVLLINEAIKSSLHIIRMLTTGSAVMYFSRFILEEYIAYLFRQGEVSMSRHCEICLPLLESSIFLFLPLICMVILLPLVFSKREHAKHTALLIYDSILGLIVLFDLHAYNVLVDYVKHPL